MTVKRIIPVFLMAILGCSGLGHAAVIRQKADEVSASTLALDPRPVATGFQDENASNSATAEEMAKKKKAKKKKKKKSKAS